MSKKISAIIEKEPYCTTIQSENHEIWSDEPLSLGGQNKGLSPSQLLSSSLASCTVITMRMYADRKGYELDKVRVEVEKRKDMSSQKEYLEKKIWIEGDLKEEESKRLFTIASRCPIHKLLQECIEIQSELMN